MMILLMTTVLKRQLPPVLQLQRHQSESIGMPGFLSLCCLNLVFPHPMFLPRPGGPMPPPPQGPRPHASSTPNRS